MHKHTLKDIFEQWTIESVCNKRIALSTYTIKHSLHNFKTFLPAIDVIALGVNTNEPEHSPLSHRHEWLYENRDSSAAIKMVKRVYIIAAQYLLEEYLVYENRNPFLLIEKYIKSFFF